MRSSSSGSLLWNCVHSGCRNTRILSGRALGCRFVGGISTSTGSGGGVGAGGDLSQATRTGTSSSVGAVTAATGIPLFIFNLSSMHILKETERRTCMKNCESINFRRDNLYVSRLARFELELELEQQQLYPATALGHLFPHWKLKHPLRSIVRPQNIAIKHDCWIVLSNAHSTHNLQDSLPRSDAIKHAPLGENTSDSEEKHHSDCFDNRVQWNLFYLTIVCCQINFSTLHRRLIKYRIESECLFTRCCW